MGSSFSSTSKTERKRKTDPGRFAASVPYCLSLILNPGLHDLADVGAGDLWPIAVHEKPNMESESGPLGSALHALFNAVVEGRTGERERRHLNAEIEKRNADGRSRPAWHPADLRTLRSPVMPGFVPSPPPANPPLIPAFTQGDLADVRNQWAMNGRAERPQNDQLRANQLGYWGSSRQLLYSKIIRDILEGAPRPVEEKQGGRRAGGLAAGSIRAKSRGVRTRTPGRERVAGRRKRSGGNDIPSWKPHPLFGLLVNPTGGIVGAGASDIEEGVLWLFQMARGPLAYHSAIHDAAGYAINYHRFGPGYSYRSTVPPSDAALVPTDEDRDELGIATDSPLSFQQGGVKFWELLWARTKAG
jgi:hypothetical protein